MERSIILGALTIFTVLTGCSKYEQVGPPDFIVDLQFHRSKRISPGEVVTTHTITGLTINGHPIALVRPVSSTESCFEVETDEYGTIQLCMEESGKTFDLGLFLTEEQQESIRALGPPPPGTLKESLRGPDTSPPGAIRSIAVLPVHDLSGGATRNPLADTLSEKLIAVLIDIGEFDRVAPLSSVMALKETFDLSQIARELGVEAILEGTVRFHEKRVRLTISLIYVPQDLHLWSESYERDVDALDDVIREIGTKVSRHAEDAHIRGSD